MNDYPISVGNVTYLKVTTAKDALAEAAKELSESIDLESYIEDYRAQLKLHGRPCENTDIEIWYSITLTDLLTNGSMMIRAPWYALPHQRRDGAVAIVQVLTGEGCGWWAEVVPGVLLHTNFDGSKGLNAHQMACFLCESQTPAPALVEWLSEYLKPGRGEHNLDFGHLPEGIVNLLSYDTKTQRRFLSFSNTAGTDEVPLFRATERPNLDFMF